MGVREQNKRNSTLLGQGSNSLVWLVAANIVMYVLLLFIELIYLIIYDNDSTFAATLFQTQVAKWIVVPGRWDVLITRPWTILTYMFSQSGIWQLISNMLWLWAFGYILQDLTGNKKIIPIYLFGGLTGALFFVLTGAFFHSGSIASLTGSGAAVMCVATATTTLAPNYRIFPMLNGGIALWILMLIFAVIDFAFIAGAGVSILMSHVAGASVGFFFIRRLRMGNDWSLWMTNVAKWVENIFSPKEKNAGTTHDKSHDKRSSYRDKVIASQQRIDEILDKINQKGYRHLNEEDKAILREAAGEK